MNLLPFDELHQIPETGYKELKTQAYLLDYISKLPSEHLEVKMAYGDFGFSKRN